MPGDPFEFAGPSLEGGYIDSVDFKGHPVAVVFWASWCGFCKKEIPRLIKLNDKYAHTGLRVVGINTDVDREAASHSSKELAMPWRNIHFPAGAKGQSFRNPISVRYNIGGIPAMFLVDRQGKVIVNNVHQLNFESEVERLVSR